MTVKKEKHEKNLGKIEMLTGARNGRLMV